MANNCADLVSNLIKSYAEMGCRMSVKVHLLRAHVDKFKENLEAYSEERFHQDIKNFEI